MNKEFKVGKDYIGMGVFALIKNSSNQFLLMKAMRTEKRDAEYEKWWKMPGGTIEYGETAEEALFREIKEETNLNVKIEQFLGYNDYIKKDKHWIALNFLVCVEKGNVKNREPEKHKELRWFLINEIPENISPFAKECLKKI